MQTAARYRFSGYEIDEAALELRDTEGERVEIPPLAFDLLVYLLRHRNRVVPKEELIERMWGKVVVSPSSLSQGIWAVRRAVRDTGGEQRVIKNVRGRGYRLVAEVEVAAAPPVAPAASAKSSPRIAATTGSLVGRDAELARLRTALDDALAGRGQLCLLAGWPGIGKTRIAQELCAIARGRGARVVEGRCFEEESQPPLWPWQQMARALMREQAPAELAAGAGDGAGDLVKLIPELDEGIPGLPETLQREPNSERYHLFDALLGFLQRTAEQAPLVLVLEDLHWADQSTLRFLDYAAPALARTRVLLVATLRSSAGDAALESTVASLLRQPSAHLIELTGLDATSVEALLRLHEVAALDERLVGRVHALTFGNPFFVTRLAQWLVSHPGLAVDAPLELPHEARIIVRELVAELPSPCRELLNIAAVLGQTFHITDLRRVSGRAAPEVLGQLEDALRGRIVHEDEEDVGLFRFAHPTIRETLYNDLPYAERVQLHGRVAAGIAQAYADDPTPRLTELARHYYEAAAGGFAHEAVRFCRLAAERAFEATAFEESVAHGKRALAALELVEPSDERTRCELLLGLGRSMRGTQVALEQAQAVFANAAEIALRIGDAALLCEAAMRHAGRGAMRMAVMREAGTVNPAEIKWLECALDRTALGDGTKRRALVEAWLANSMYHSDRREQRKEHARRAVEVARSGGDPAVLAECTMLLQASVTGPAELDTRIDRLTEVIEITRRHGMTGLQIDAHGERAFAYWERADRERAEADVQAVERLADQLRQPREKRVASIWRATLLDADGRFDDAARVHAELARLHPPPPGRVPQGRAIRDLHLQYLRDRCVDSIAGLEAYAAKFPLPVAWQCALPGTYASAGRLAEAQRELDRLAIDDFAAIPDDHNYINSHFVLAWAAGLLRDQDRCAALYRKLAPYAERMIVAGWHGGCRGVVHRALGDLSLVVGELARAEAHLNRAIEVDSKLGATLWAAFGRLGHARLLLERNARGDRAQAVQEVAEVIQYARARGVPALLSQAEQTSARAVERGAPSLRA